MSLNPIRFFINKAKPETWIIPGLHYYSWFALIIAMSSLYPMVVISDFLEILRDDPWRLIPLIIISLMSICSIGYAAYLITVMIKFDFKNKSISQVFCSEVRFMKWLIVATLAMLLVGTLLMIPVWCIVKYFLHAA